MLWHDTFETFLFLLSLVFVGTTVGFWPLVRGWLRAQCQERQDRGR